ncbi:hypothetical protein [Nocardia fluminea]|uniref:hypothetical protein n=1 Tax=Nocardia fluminea TaxID=134984 RepID=UPI00364FD1A1
MAALNADSRCRSCSAPIAWRRTAEGKRIPLDPEPVAGGNLMIAGNGTALVVGPTASPAINSDIRYVSHFATCPNADSWRSKGAKR